MWQGPPKEHCFKESLYVKKSMYVATMYSTVLIKDFCNSKKKQKQISTEMKKYAKTSCKYLRILLSYMTLGKRLFFFWVSYKIPEFSPFTLGGTSFFILKFQIFLCPQNPKPPSFRGTVAIFPSCFFKQTFRQKSWAWGVSGDRHTCFYWRISAA